MPDELYSSSRWGKAAKNAKQVGLTRDHSHTTHMTYGRQAYSFVDKDWIENGQVGVTGILSNSIGEFAGN
jgi:hypothetical protein